MYKTYIVVVRVDVAGLDRRDVESITGLVVPADKPVHTGVCELLKLREPSSGVEVFELYDFTTVVNNQACDDFTACWVSYVYKETE